jgi:hypothetical protein
VTPQSAAKAQLSALLSRFPPGIIALAKRCLPKLRRAFPGCFELVYDYPNSVVVSFGKSERGIEAVVSISILPRGLRLYIDKSVPDPKGLLEGTASKVRFLTLESASQLDRGDVKDLIDAAIEHAGATFPRTGPTRVVIKSESRKRRPSKTGRA